MIFLTTFMLGFPPYEHKYSFGNTEICACEHFYVRSPHMNISILQAVLTSALVKLGITAARLTSMRGTMIFHDDSMLGFPHMNINILLQKLNNFENIFSTKKRCSFESQFSAYLYGLPSAGLKF